MANRHFGNLGDVWKHLPLAEILRTERPTLYAESHAGSWDYPAANGWRERFGVGGFLARASRHDALRSSAYAEVLQRAAATTPEPPVCPGSPRIAVESLGDAADYIFCDLDADSLQSIRQGAAHAGVDRAHIRCRCADGNAEVMATVEPLSAAQSASALVLLDPYRPFDALDGGPTSAEAFALAALRGCRAVLWFAFAEVQPSGRVDRILSREGLHEALRLSLATAGVDPAALPIRRAEIWLRNADALTPDQRPGVGGCGLLCANLSDESTSACERLGAALVSAYAGESLPGGVPGALEFDCGFL